MDKSKEYIPIRRFSIFPGLIILTLICVTLTSKSCSNDPDEICQLSFCLDTLSNNTIDLVNYPVIDVHQHIYRSNFWHGGTSNIGLVSASSYIIHYTSLVEIMKENNVVLGLAGGPLDAVDYYYDEYPENNDMFWYGAEDNLSGNRLSESNLSSIAKAIEEGRIMVIGELVGIYQGIPYDNESYQRLYAIADTFSLPVFIHTGIVPIEISQFYPKYGFELSNPVHLRPVLESYPNVNFNAAHFGISNHDDYDFEDVMLGMMADYDNLWVDIGATTWYNSVGTQKTTNFIKRAISMGVEDKILYASDEMVWPDAVTVSIEYVKNADFLTVEQKKKILYWNAVEYLKLSDEEIEVHFGR